MMMVSPRFAGFDAVISWYLLSCTAGPGNTPGEYADRGTVIRLLSSPPKLTFKVTEDWPVNSHGICTFTCPGPA